MLKIKPLSKEQIIISIDRLTRFKNPEVKYLRVFKDILTNNLISPKFKKSELDEMDYTELKNYAEYIINYSLEKLGFTLYEDYTINQRLYEYETNTFNTDKNIRELLNNKINYKTCIELIPNNCPINLKWLKNLDKCTNLIKAREDLILRFPLEKVVISEGITEEILLPEFAKLCGYDFDKNGVCIISAGGKNQVVKLFYQLAESLKLPIFVLMDKDAEDNYNDIKPRLREFDRVHLLECGEFEDVLPINLVKKTLSYGLKNISMIELEAVNQECGMVKILEEIFRHRGMHEFKKSEFAQMVKENLTCEADVSPEIAEIIKEIKITDKNLNIMVDI